jgi:hypothetical protein
MPPPGGERFGGTPIARARSTGRLMGWEGAHQGGRPRCPQRLARSYRRWRVRSLRDHGSLRIGCPGLFAGHTGHRRVPNAGGERAVRATPAPPRLPAQGRRRGRQGHRRGSGPVGVGGVPPTQGVRASRRQGKGVETCRAPSTRTESPRLSRTAGGIECEHGLPAGIGAPDVVQATCPVRGALGGNLLLRGSKASSFDSMS